MIRPNKTLSVFRDLVTIIGILLLCLLALQQFTDRAQARRDEQARFAVVQNALTQMDAAYRQQIEASQGDLNQIILRQNQMLLEYQKLMLATEFMPASAVRRAPEGGAAGQGQGQGQGQPGQQQPGAAGRPSDAPHVQPQGQASPQNQPGGPAPKP